MTHETAQLFFENFIGEPSSEFTVLAQSGSARVNYLAANVNKKFIVTFNENVRENEAFFYFSDIFKNLNLNTPEVFKISDDRKLYIQEYLGGNTLSEVLENEGLNGKTKNLVKESLVKLYQLQRSTENKVDFSQTFEYESYDDLPVIHDLYYFKNFSVDVLEINYHKSLLLKEFKKIAQKIENLSPKGLMIRDFQARNIMVNDENEFFFIDYQSAMNGPLMYDVISFLFQARANFPENFRVEMLDYYFSLWKDEEKISELKNSVNIIRLMRYLQVLGAYGFRGLIQRKPHFLASLEKGINNLYNFSNVWKEMDDFPELKKVINELNSEVTRMKIEKMTNNFQ